MNPPINNAWYNITPFDGDIIRLQEAFVDEYWSGSIWLVQGSECTVVIDSGTGVVPPAPVVASLTDKPVLAIALTRYYDHAGGLYSFEQRACHPLEADSITSPTADNWQNFIRQERFAELPYADYIHKNYTMHPAQPTQLLEHGEMIDLGNRILEVLHIPGRTPGSIALWEADSGFLFGGETVFIDPIPERDFPPQNTQQYEASLKMLSRLPVKTVFGGHYSSFNAQVFQDLVMQEIGRYP